MSDMEKVRVSFTDADGNEHKIVGWRVHEDGPLAEILAYPSDGNVLTGEVPWSVICEASLVEPIRELPTGVGAVIRLRGDFGAVLVRNQAGIWCAEDSEYDLTPQELAELDYEVLSEGIQL